MEAKERQIRDIFFEVYDKCYIGYLEIKEILPFGYSVAIGFDRTHNPLYVTAELEWDDFCKFFKQELRDRRLSSTQYYNGYKYDAFDQPYHRVPINHHDHGHDITENTSPSYKDFHERD